MNDLRFALRQLAKSPGFTATVIITLALGISGCVTIVALVDSVLLRRYAAYSERSIVIGHTRPPDTTLGSFLRPAWPALSSGLKSFELLNASFGAPLPLMGEGEPLTTSVLWVTQHYFAFHGNRFITGREFSAEEYASEQAKAGITSTRGGVVILAHGLWQRAFGGRDDIVGHTIQLSGAAYTVVGVATDGFASVNASAEAFFPFNSEGRRSGPMGITVTGRLKPGVTLSQAQAELDVSGVRLAEQIPETRGFAAIVAPMRAFLTRDSRPVLLMLLGAVLCVLLIVCANIASLQLMRATLRQREISVRAALGASRSRIVRQLLTESMLLAIAGGAAGAFIAQWTLAALRAYPRVRGIDTAAVEMDGRLIAFAIGLSALTALLFGLAPAWLSSKVDLNDALKQGTRGSTESAARSRFRQLFVILQVGVATVLLVTAGLLIRSFIQVARVDLGLVPENTFTASMPGQTAKYSGHEHQTAFLDAVLTKIRSLPGVDAAGVTFATPFSPDPGRLREYRIDSRPAADPGHELKAFLSAVSPGYFGAVRIQLLGGRNFNDHDDLQAPRVLIVNHAFARQHFPGENPVGQRVTTETASCEIIGVVADAIQASSEQPVTAQMYRPLAQDQLRAGLVLFVRSARDIADLGRAVKAQVHEVDPNQPLGPITPVQETLDRRVRDRRFQLHMLSVFSVLALAISAVGIYGLISYSVSQRTTEIGIRMALGAQATDVARLILKQGTRLIGIGLLVGLGGAIVVGRIIQAYLFQVSSWDPTTLVLTAVVIAGVGLAACFIPTRRATKVDPIVALRAE
jgi:putative ABC transport system permease protein